jgi:hypothetical protein
MATGDKNIFGVELKPCYCRGANVGKMTPAKCRRFCRKSNTFGYLTGGGSNNNIDQTLKKIWR